MNVKTVVGELRGARVQSLRNTRTEKQVNVGEAAKDIKLASIVGKCRNINEEYNEK